jgi:enoyl-CoA hydratase/carnithine racemase
MSIMHWEKVGAVARIVMTDGENRHKPEYNETILRLFDEIEADKDIRSVIITSYDPKFFSLGIDLDWAMRAHSDPKRAGEMKAFLYGLNKMFKRILLFPTPVIAVINGHAFGDGSIMACACDFRLMRADRGFFCFPEVDINIPFMPGMLALVRRAIPGYKFEEMALTGKRVGGKEMEEHHIVIKACADEKELQEAGLAFAKTFQKERGIFGELKKRMNKEIVRVMDEEDPPYIEAARLLA